MKSLNQQHGAWPRTVLLENRKKSVVEPCSFPRAREIPRGQGGQGDTGDEKYRLSGPLGVCQNRLSGMHSCFRNMMPHGRALRIPEKEKRVNEEVFPIIHL